jgi:sugar O-acyltransferase (sialic acid O-acetyltransferase NeuD family)
MPERMIIGAGRHAVETYYLLEDIGIAGEVAAFVVDHPEANQRLLGIGVLSIYEVMERFAGREMEAAVLVAIGAVEANKRMAKLFRDKGFPFFNAIVKEVRTDRQKYIGEGVTIAKGCILTCNISVGDHTIINIGTTISHDCIIGKHVNISPGCHLAGNVRIDDDVFVGAGATFIPKVQVGEGSVIAAGACVTKDVAPYTMVAGVPALIKKKL